jgi:hypothetical protein
MVDCGIPNRLAAALPPVDSANLTASALNSSVYRRFGTDSFFPISPSVHQNVTNILMYVKPGQVQGPGLGCFERAVQLSHDVAQPKSTTKPVRCVPLALFRR